MYHLISRYVLPRTSSGHHIQTRPVAEIRCNSRMPPRSPHCLRLRFTEPDQLILSAVDIKTKLSISFKMVGGEFSQHLCILCIHIPCVCICYRPPPSFDWTGFCRGQMTNSAKRENKYFSGFEPLVQIFKVYDYIVTVAVDVPNSRNLWVTQPLWMIQRL